MSDAAVGGLGRSSDGFSSVWWRESRAAAKEQRRAAKLREEEKWIGFV
jgi:hypothetical protein